MLGLELLCLVPPLSQPTTKNFTKKNTPLEKYKWKSGEYGLTSIKNISRKANSYVVKEKKSFQEIILLPTSVYSCLLYGLK